MPVIGYGVSWCCVFWLAAGGADGELSFRRFVGDDVPVFGDEAGLFGRMANVVRVKVPVQL